MNAIFWAAVVCAYFLGNISPSTLIGRAHGIDIKKEGSGNAGTTNTLRVLGLKAAAVTLLVDVAKGAAAVFIGQLAVGHTCAMVCALAVFLGHIWPVLLKFQGGKGVASAFGAITALNWQLGLLCLAVVVAAVLITRKVSLGSIIVAAAFPFMTWHFERDFIYIGTLMACIMLFKHRTNMVRLIHGEESNISFRHKGGEAASPADGGNQNTESEGEKK